MRRMLANMLQALYERDRVPETWGSPHVSGPTFEALRTKGFRVAGKYLFQRLQEVGYQEVSPCHKFMTLVTGVILVAIVNTCICRFFHEERSEVTSYGKRIFSDRVPQGLIALYTLGAACSSWQTVAVTSQHGFPIVRERRSCLLILLVRTMEETFTLKTIPTSRISRIYRATKIKR